MVTQTLTSTPAVTWIDPRYHVGSSNVISCYPYTVVNAGYNLGYNRLQKLSSDIDSRPKPDPLTDTATPSQWTRRQQPSVLPSQLDFVENAYCNGVWGTRTWFTRGQYTLHYEDHNVVPDTDWGAKAIQDAASHFVNLGSSVAEYRETGRMFAHFAKSVAGAWRTYKDVKKLKFKKPLTPCSVVAAEIAYSFGIKPLAEDLFSAAEALQLRLGLPLVYKYSSQSRASNDRDLRSTPVTMSTDSVYNQRYIVTDRVKMLIGLRTLGDSEIVFGNPTNWAWELIPFSFVVDWGIPIGQWLEDLDTLKNISFVSGTRTRKRHVVGYWKCRAKNQAGVWLENSSTGKYVFKWHARYLVSSLPTPPVPSWSPSATYHKVYRAVSLLIGVNQPCRKYSGRKRGRSS